MVEQQKLKVGTGLVALVMVGLIGFQLVQQAGQEGQSDSQATDAKVAPLELKKFGSTDRPDSLGDSKSSFNKSKLGTLRLGRIGAVPTLDEIQSLERLPVLDSQIRRVYGAAKTMTCRMLATGSSVKAAVSLPKEGETGSIGRVPAMTVGLSMDPVGRSKLPAVTRGQVDDYLAKHRLSIQPTVHVDENGHLYFGTDCQAAFYEIDRPGIAVAAEPMIESAVERFRSLGIAGVASDLDGLSATAKRTLATDRGRTLVMAFRFEKADLTISSVGEGGRNITELLFFHLPASTATWTSAIESINNRQPIPLEVFLTSDERRSLHRLDRNLSNLNAPSADIAADIRFEKMVLMGLYPAEPVVTDIHYRSAGIISMEIVNQLMGGLKDQSPMSLDDVLDRFGLLSGSQTANSPTIVENASAEDDARWRREMSRSKYERLEEALQPPDVAERAVELPKVPLMTGLGK